MQFKDKDIKKVFLQYWRHSDVTKWDTVFSHESKSLYMVVLFIPTIIVFLLSVALEWSENVYRNTKKEKLISYGLQFNVKLTAI